MSGIQMPVQMQRGGSVIQPGTSKYDTALSPDDERAYQKWAAKYPSRTSTVDYDMRGWWKENGNVDPGSGHFTDKYKKPNHPTFSDQSMYNGIDGNQGGTWTGSEKTGWNFRPGKTNLQNQTPDQLQQYWNRVEAPHGNILLLPSQPK